mmetsp:Transcript_10320/g.24399  ORF Transcript_10320/g.24399 Transcript_10320/m.24399 type:complete len:242 (-) Transcript_10320:981-1706(-)
MAPNQAFSIKAPRSRSGLAIARGRGAEIEAPLSSDPVSASAFARVYRALASSKARRHGALDVVGDLERDVGEELVVLRVALGHSDAALARGRDLALPHLEGEVASLLEVAGSVGVLGGIVGELPEVLARIELRAHVLERRRQLQVPLHARLRRPHVTLFLRDDAEVAARERLPDQRRHHDRVPESLAVVDGAFLVLVERRVGDPEVAVRHKLPRHVRNLEVLVVDLDRGLELLHFLEVDAQ